MMRPAAACCGALAAIAASGMNTAAAAEAPVQIQPLEVEAKIPLGDIRGRIDHLAFDPGRQKLYVAELGNDSVGVVDLGSHKTLRTLTGLNEPQGIGYVPSTDTLYVANAGDGSVRLFQGEDLMPAGQISLGNDADNVRVDDAAHRVYVGYGNGALAVIDTQSKRKIADIPLHAHPEGFQLDSSGARIFVNVPNSGEIAVVDRLSDRQIASWPTKDLRANFPLAMDESHLRVITVFRHPAKAAAFRAEDGRLLGAVNTCGDADDVFADPKRNRVYVICGEGFIDVLAAQGEGFVSIGRFSTASGARTGFYIADLDRIVLAVRKSGTIPAAIWVLRSSS